MVFFGCLVQSHGVPYLILRFLFIWLSGFGRRTLSQFLLKYLIGKKSIRFFVAGTLDEKP